jgi:GTP-binding protein
VLNAEFSTTVAKLSDLPFDSTHEVAFAGRSNVGKSSAINTLARHKRLAFVSKTPGRTQHLNFFSVGAQRYLVDLPGYGYAKVPLAQQNSWQRLIGGYLMGRAPLRGVVLIMDIRHPFTELDEQMLNWFSAAGKPVLVLLSKSDKLSRGARMATLRQVQARLAGVPVAAEAMIFSSLKQEGVEAAEAHIRAWLEMADKKAIEQAKKSPAQGEEAGPQDLNIGVKVPAQGGEAEDE